MPLYEYHCQACKSQHEILQKLSDAPATECPTCGEAALSKSVSAPGFRLAGGGWYETDFKTGAKKNLSGDSGAPTEAASTPAAAPTPAAATTPSAASSTPSAAAD